MTIAVGGFRGTAQNATSSASFVLTTNANETTVGQVLTLLVVTRENVAISSIEDSSGNTWVKAGRYSNTTNGDAHVELWICQAVNGLPAASTVTMTYPSAVLDKCCAMHAWNVASGKTLKQSALAGVIGNEVNGTTDFGSVTYVGSITGGVQRLWYRVLAKRANTTAGITVSSGFTNLSLASRSRNDAANAIVPRGEFRFSTAAGETSNPPFAVSGNTAGLFFALEEADPVEAPTGIVGSLAGTLGALTASASGTVESHGALSATLGALTASATGTVAVQGSVSATLGPLTVYRPTIEGTLSATLGSLTASAKAVQYTYPGQIALLKPWVNYANVANKAEIYAELQTLAVGNANLTFFETTFGDYNQQAAILRAALPSLKFKGVTAENYDGYKALWEDAPYITAPKPDIPRAVYAWAETEELDPGQDPLVTPTKRAALAQWCADRGVSVVFLDIRNYVMAPNATPSKLAKLRDMVARLSAVGCETYAMSFNLAWLAPGALAGVEENLLQKIAEYNASSAENERFTGCHYDIEYWLEPAASQYTPTEALTALKALMDSTRSITGLPCGMFSAAGLINGTTYTVGGFTGTQGEIMLRMCDHMVPAGYADDANTQISYVQRWVDRADPLGTCKIWCGTETIYIGQPLSETYYQSSRPEMEAQLAIVMEHFAGRPSYEGIAVHSYDGWRALYPTPAPVGFDIDQPVWPDVADISGGGFPVTIKGYGFVEGMTIRIGGVNATNVVINSPTECTCIPGAHAQGVVNIEILLPGDSVDSSRGQGAESFEYWSPRQMPSVDAVLHAGKGTTTSGNKVSAWLDQSANAVSFTQSTDAERPELVPNAIGSMPVLRYTKGQSLGVASPRVSSTGLTYYIVARYTSTDTTKTDSRDVPLTVIGNSTASGTNAAGFSGSSLAYTNIVAGTPTTYTKVTSPALNDGQVWLSGWNHATGTGSGNLRPYVGSDLGDTAQAGNVPYDTVNNGYDRIGVGHDPTDGFEGDLAAVIITRATPNLVNRQKLHKWAMQQFGVSGFNYTA